MSTKQLRERARGWANRLAVYFELSGKDKCDTAQLLRDLCAEIERLEKRVETFQEYLLNRCEQTCGDWRPASERLHAPNCPAADLALRGEGGKG